MKHYQSFLIVLLLLGLPFTINAQALSTIASFILSPDIGSSPLTVTFEAADDGQSDPAGTSVTYLWLTSAGHAQEISCINPESCATTSLVFSEVGTFTTHLTVTKECCGGVKSMAFHSGPLVTVLEGYTLTINNSGGGTVTGLGIDCPTTCEASYPKDQLVTLTATPNADYQFLGWGDDCNGSLTTERVRIDSDKLCTAVFELIPAVTFSLTVTNSGNGTVTTNVGGIDCGTVCQDNFLFNQLVTLTATPNADSQFVDWGGDCNGSLSTQRVRIDSDKHCTAIFELIPASTFWLTIYKSGNGTITSNVGGIDCGTVCTQPYSVNQLVTLSATPQSDLKKWYGDCRGTRATNRIRMTEDKTCSVLFNGGAMYQLVVTPNPSDEGIVMGPLINCGEGETDCDEDYADGADVLLLALPATGFELSHWTGDCSGTEPGIMVEITRDLSCGVVFDIN